MASLKFILGTALVDHQAALVDDLATQLAAHPTDRFFYLVPNHIKFSSEIDVLSQLKRRQGTALYAQSQVQVLSFSRLAWFLLRDQPAFTAPRVSPTGLTMLTAAVIKQFKPAELGLFAKESQHPGFIQELTKQFVELRNANVAPDDYQQIREKSQQWAKDHHLPVAFDDKLAVLFKLYAAFVDKLGDQLETPAIYDLLVKALNEGDFSDTHFYLDRYNAQFLAKEEQVVEAMIRNGAATTVSLVLDRPWRGTSLPPVSDLFCQPGLIYHRLFQYATSQGVLVEPDAFAPILRVPADFAGIERWLAATSNFTTPDPAPTVGDHLHFFTAPTRVAELNRVAATIRQLVASGDYRYRDFLVLTRHLDGYEAMLAPVFAAHEVPVFNDNDRPMKTHPLVTLIAGLFQLYWGNYQLADLMQVLKTDLLVPKGVAAADFRRALTLTENWALKYGKSGPTWLGTRPFTYTPNLKLDQVSPEVREVEEERRAQLKLVKDYVKGQLAPLFGRLKQASTGREAAGALFTFLVDQGVPDQLAAWQTRAVDQGDLSLSQEPEQVWQLLCQLLDEYVLTMGDDAAGYSLHNFRDLLLVGFETATYSQIPSTLDQVLVSESGITQTEHRKVVFLIGATDDVMPETKLAPGLLADDERQALSASLAPGQYLPVSGLSRVANEPFLNYLAMLTARDQLYLSAPRLADEDDPAGLSPYLTGLAAYFKRPIENYPATARPAAAFADLRPFVSAPAATRTSFIRARRIGQDDKEPFARGWRLILTYLNEQALGPRLTLEYHYKNEPQSLPPALATQLFGQLDPQQAAARARTLQAGEVPAELGTRNTLLASVSQLQTYYQNPYEYFLRYGLKLKERAEYEITPADSGTFYHDALANFITRTKDRGLKDLSPAALTAETTAALTWAHQQQTRFALEPDQPDYHRLRYQLGQLDRLAATMIRVLFNQAQVSGASPAAAERAFGRGAWPALTYPLGDGHQVLLRGRVDRIDHLPVADRQYQLVIDYKSSNRSFDLVKAASGLDLQLVTYLAALKQHSADPLAGAFYLHLNDPVVSLRGRTKNWGDYERFEHRYQGLVLDDPELLRLLDQGIGQDKAGLLLRAGFKKKTGQITASQGSALFTPAELDWLLNHNRDLITAAARAIFAGEIDLAPYRYTSGSTTETGLTLGKVANPYLPIFAFDNVLDQDKFREIKLTEAAFKEQMQADIADDGKEDDNGKL